MSAVRVTHRIAALAGAGVAAVGLFSLVAWGAGVGLLTSVRAEYIPMAPLTSLMFLLLGVVLLADAQWPRSPLVGSIISVAVSLTWIGAGLTLLQALTHIGLPWDGWLVTAAALEVDPAAGRVSPLTAVVFLLSTPQLLRPLSGRGVFMGLAGMGTSGLALLIAFVVVLSYWAGAPLLYGMGAVPMALLTAMTFAVFNTGVLLHRSSSVLLREWREGQGYTDGRESRVRLRYIATAGLGLAVVIGLLGFYYLRDRQAAARAAMVEQLEAVVTMKAREIATWRQERLSEARFLANTPAVAEDLVAILDARPDPVPRQRLMGLLDTIKGGDRYESVSVFTPEGALLLSLPEAPPLGPQSSPAALSTVARGSDVFFTDLHTEPGGPSHLELLAPIRSPRDPSRCVAVIVLRLDPTRVLFPLVGAWPLATASAASYLIRREGERIEFLTTLRDAPTGTTSIHRSANEPSLSAALALRDRPGTHEGRDYRGAPVVFSARAIPGSSWTLIAEVPQSEAYALARREAWLGGGLVAGLLLALGQAVVFVWRQRQAEFLRRALAAEQEHRSVSERLAILTRHANDVVLLFDQTGRLVEANDRCLTVYGRSPDEMTRLTAGDLRLAEDAQAAAQDFASILASDGRVFETFHRRADDSRFPVEVSARPVTIQGERYVLSINRDITERRAQEREIERLSRLYSALSRVNEAIVRSRDRDGLLAEVCRSLVEAGGFELAWVGWRDPVSHEVQAASVFGDLTGYLESLRIRRDGSGFGTGVTGGALRENRIVVRNDFLRDPGTEPWREAAMRAGIQASISLPIQAMGRTVAALNVYAREAGFFREKEIGLLKEAAADITFGLENLDREEKRLAADASLHASLREKEALLKEVHHRVKNNLQIILSLLRLETARASELATSLVLRDMQGRIHSMALLHETLYKTGNFSGLDLEDYLGRLATQVIRAQGADLTRISLVQDLASVPLDIDHAIPCGLIVTELLTNSIKYAFPGDARGEVRLSLRPGEGHDLVVEVADDGVGLPADLDERRAKSLGLQLVSDLARQLGGRLDIVAAQGATFRVTFPAPQFGGVSDSFVRSTG